MLCIAYFCCSYSNKNEVFSLFLLRRFGANDDDVLVFEMQNQMRRRRNIFEEMKQLKKWHHALFVYDSISLLIQK
jgi:hypothetical protein